MNLKGIHYVKRNKSDRKRQIPYDLSCKHAESKNTQTNKTQAYRYGEQMGSCQRQGVRGGKSGYRGSKSKKKRQMRFYQD